MPLHVFGQLPCVTVEIYGLTCISWIFLKENEETSHSIHPVHPVHTSLWENIYVHVTVCVWVCMCVCCVASSSPFPEGQEEFRLPFPPAVFLNWSKMAREHPLTGQEQFRTNLKWFQMLMLYLKVYIKCCVSLHCEHNILTGIVSEFRQGSVVLN